MIYIYETILYNINILLNLKGELMCKFLKRLFIFLAVIFAIAVGVYYFTQFFKRYLGFGSKNPNVNENEESSKKEQTKRHYTKLTLPTE